MKTIIAAATAATFAFSSAVQAGGLADAVMEDEIIVIEETQAGSLPGWVIPLAIVGIVIAVASSNDDERQNGNGGNGNGNNGNVIILTNQTCNLC